MVGVRLLKYSLCALQLMGAVHVSASDYTYTIYIGMGPIKVPAGSAQLYDTPVVYDGHDAIRTTMVMSTYPSTDKIFTLRDTIESYNTRQNESIFFKKTINEGSRHSIETARFSKDNNRFIVNLETWDMTTGKQSGHSTEWRPTRIYDLMSMMAFAQTIDTSDLEPGSTESIPMVNGNRVVQMYLVYTGKKKIKADNGQTYNCIVVSIRDYKEGKELEIIKAYVTDDSRHTPIQLDIKLGVGTSIKALLK